MVVGGADGAHLTEEGNLIFGTQHVEEAALVVVVAHAAAEHSFDIVVGSGFVPPVDDTGGLLRLVLELAAYQTCKGLDVGDVGCLLTTDDGLIATVGVAHLLEERPFGIGELDGLVLKELR